MTCLMKSWAHPRPWIPLIKNSRSNWKDHCKIPSPSLVIHTRVVHSSRKRPSGTTAAFWWIVSIRQVSLKIGLHARRKVANAIKTGRCQVTRYQECAFGTRYEYEGYGYQEWPRQEYCTCHWSQQRQRTIGNYDIAQWRWDGDGTFTLRCGKCQIEWCKYLKKGGRKLCKGCRCWHVDFCYIAIACANIVRCDPEFDSIGTKEQDHTPNEKVIIHHDGDWASIQRSRKDCRDLSTWACHVTSAWIQKETQRT